MNTEQFTSLLRTLLKFAGGYLVAKGITDAATVDIIVGGFAAAGGLIWSQATHK